jgi:ABC-2 type transport system ATP-binding protein
VQEGATVLLTTQYLEEADRLADRIIVIDDGQVIAEGSASHLKSQFGSTIIEVGLPTVASALRARVLLKPLALHEPEQSGSTVRITVTDGPETLVEALRVLDAESLPPSTLVVREPSLDDVFLTLTGRRAEPDEPADADSASSEASQTRGAA